MDVVSYSLASKQAKRIEEFIENPDSTSGLLSLPKKIEVGESITIPDGRVVVHPNLEIDGTLTIENDGELFVPFGGTLVSSDLMHPVDTIDDLRNETGKYKYAYVTGYHTKDDGAFGSNMFEWDSTSTEEDNGGTIIKLDNIVTGRYKLRYSGAVNVKWFGAKGNGVTDDTVAIQSAINAYNTVKFYSNINEDETIYKLTTVNTDNNTLEIEYGQTILSDENVTLLFSIPDDANGIYIKQPIVLKNKKKATIQGFNLLRTGTGGKAIYTESDNISGSYWTNYSPDLVVKNNYFGASTKLGLHEAWLINIEINDIRSGDIRNNKSTSGFSPYKTRVGTSDTIGIKLSGNFINSFMNIKDNEIDTVKFGIYAEGNVEHCEISNNKLTNCENGIYDVSDSSQSQGYQIENNWIDARTIGVYVCNRLGMQINNNAIWRGNDGYEFTPSVIGIYTENCGTMISGNRVVMGSIVKTGTIDIKCIYIKNSQTMGTSIVNNEIGQIVNSGANAITGIKIDGGKNYIVDDNIVDATSVYSIVNSPTNIQFGKYLLAREISGYIVYDGDGTFDAPLISGFGKPLAIISGAIDITHKIHRIDTESLAITDDLITINGGQIGDIVTLITTNSGRDVTVKTDALGNIVIADGTGDVMVSSNYSISLLKVGRDTWRRFNDVPY